MTMLEAKQIIDSLNAILEQTMKIQQIVAAAVSKQLENLQ